MEDKKVVQGARSLLVMLSLTFFPFSPTSASNSNELGYSINGATLAQNTFVYNPKSLKWQAIKNGKVIRSGRGSGGSHYCKDIGRSCRTPTGTYSVISKGGSDCRSSKYPVNRGGAPMPYCMFFRKNYAIHGSPDLPARNASHGCIRVRPSDARWLNHNFMRVGSRVVVKPY